MIYRFKGRPFEKLISGRTNKQFGMFDRNGEYLTNDTEIAERIVAVGRYDYVKKEDPFEVKEEVEEEEVLEEVKEVTNKRTCKKCGEEFENQGLLLQHYKTEHPKK